MVDTNAGSKNEIMLKMVFVMQSVLAFAQRFCLLRAQGALLGFELNGSVRPQWKKQVYHQNSKKLMN